MLSPLFQAAREALFVGSHVVLDGPEGRHAANVRRLRLGESADLGDGFGRLAGGTVVAVRKGTVEVELHTVVDEPAAEPRLVVVQALPKGDRGELAAQTLTEVGVDLIVPWAAARCVTRWRDERGDRALARWQAITVEASKQSRRSWWPTVQPLVSTTDVVGLLSSAALRVVMHESALRPLSEVEVPKSGDVVVVIGPEGGIADDELTAFADVGAEPFLMGPTVLRTSTAGTVAAAVLLARSARWNGSVTGR